MRCAVKKSKAFTPPTFFNRRKAGNITHKLHLKTASIYASAFLAPQMQEGGKDIFINITLDISKKIGYNQICE